MDEAIHHGKIRTMLSGLTKGSCLIIDEVGCCELDKEETRLFFQIIDRFESSVFCSAVITRNKEPNEWVSLFHEEDALGCTLDILTENAFRQQLQRKEEDLHNLNAG